MSICYPMVIPVAAAGGAPSTPPSTSLWGWWSADKSYTETAGTPTTLITVDGTQIGSQEDRSGNGRHLYQAVGANQPVFKTSILNLLPAARYAGSTQSMTTNATTPSGNSFSMYAVANQTAVNQAYDGLFCNNDAGLVPRWSLLTNSAGNLRVFNNGNGATTTFTASTYHMIGGTVDNTGSFPTTLQIDNNAIASANATGGGGLGTAVQVGVYFNGQWTGDIIELLLYTAIHTLSSGDGLLTRQYLNGRYNLGLGI